MPSGGEFLVQVKACGICPSHIFALYNVWDDFLSSLTAKSLAMWLPLEIIFNTGQLTIALVGHDIRFKELLIILLALVFSLLVGSQVEWESRGREPLVQKRNIVLDVPI